jgi:hypothetical protein
MRTGEGGAEARLIAGAAYDVVALTLATGPSVFKPGSPRQPQRSLGQASRPGHRRTKERRMTGTSRACSLWDGERRVKTRTIVLRARPGL